MKNKFYFDNNRISKNAKDYFSSIGLEEFLQEGFIFNNSKNIIENANENFRSFSVDINKCTKEEIRELLCEIVYHKKKLLDSNGHKDVKSTFVYVWYDDMSGCFYFSAIPEENEKISENEVVLPFSGNIKKTSLEDVVDDFIKDNYKGCIPVDEMKEESFNDQDYNFFQQKVWVKKL